MNHNQKLDTQSKTLNPKRPYVAPRVDNYGEIAHQTRSGGKGVPDGFGGYNSVA